MSSRFTPTVGQLVGFWDGRLPKVIIVALGDECHSNEIRRRENLQFYGECLLRTR